MRAHLVQRSSSFPGAATSSSAAPEAQARGLRKLFHHSSRNTLRSHASDSNLIPTNSHTAQVSTQAASLSSQSRPTNGTSQPLSPNPLVDSTLRWWEELDDEDARSQDRAAVEAELARYIAEGLIGNIESGVDLLRYWTVR